MAIDLFGYRTLTAAINEIPAVENLLHTLIFRDAPVSPSENIDVDLLIGGKTKAPFVQVHEEGVVVDKLGRKMQTIKPGLVRVKKYLTGYDLFMQRFPGAQVFAGAAEIEAAAEQRIATDLQDLKNRNERTIEWLCAQALTGVVTVSQPNIAFTIDFGLPSAHKPTLGSGSKWSESGGKPIDDIRTWKKLIRSKIGAVGQFLAVCGTDVVTALYANAQVQALLNVRNAIVGQLNLTQKPNYVGNLAGVDIYEYDAAWVDDAGTETPYVAVDKFVLVAVDAPFKVQYAALADAEYGLIVQPQFAKSWLEHGLRWLQAEARPLAVPHWPEAIVYADVV